MVAIKLNTHQFVNSHKMSINIKLTEVKPKWEFNSFNIKRIRLAGHIKSILAGV